MPQILQPFPQGRDLEEAPTLQWFELVRRYINAPPYYEKDVNPTVDEVPQGTFAVWRNSTLNQVRLWANNNGVLVSVLLS